MSTVHNKKYNSTLYYSNNSGRGPNLLKEEWIDEDEEE